MLARQYLRLAQKRWITTLSVTGLSVLIAVGVTQAATPVYQATSQLFTSIATTEGDVSTLAQGNTFSQARVKSYAAIVDSPEVLNPVIRQLGLETNAADLGQNITATVPLDTVLININARDEDPDQAAAIANAVAAELARYASGVEVSPAAGTSSVKITQVRAATPPSTPISPRSKLNLALGLLVGLALGVGLAVLREGLDTRIKTESDLDYLERDGQRHVPVLGTIERDSKASRAPIIVQAQPNSRASEAFRRLRTNLQFIDIDNPPHSIVVTSAVSEEGKTTTTANLAYALAQTGIQVVVVDADLRRPSLAAVAGLVEGVGLTDVLIGRSNVADVLQVWSMPNLKILASGVTPPNPSELLGSSTMHELLRQLEAEYDIVLIDTPPLLPVTDAAVLSATAGGTLLVIRADRTTRTQVDQSIDALNAVDGNILGIVLNMAQERPENAGRYEYVERGGKLKNPWM